MSLTAARRFLDQAYQALDAAEADYPNIDVFGFAQEVEDLEARIAVAEVEDDERDPESDARLWAANMRIEDAKNRAAEVLA